MFHDHSSDGAISEHGPSVPLSSYAEHSVVPRWRPLVKCAHLLACLLVVGCASERSVPETCPENPDYYHVWKRKSSKPGSPHPTYLLHVRKENWRP